MRNEFTAVIEQDGDWYIAYSPEIPGANGQGRSREECLQSLASAIELILQDRREDGLRGVPEGAVRAVGKVGRSVKLLQHLRRCALPLAEPTHRAHRGRSTSHRDPRSARAFRSLRPNVITTGLSLDVRREGCVLLSRSRTRRLMVE